MKLMLKGAPSKTTCKFSQLAPTIRVLVVGLITMNTLFNTSSLIAQLEMTPTTNSGDVEKFVAMTCLGLGSFLVGMLPAFISDRNRHRFPLATSILLCFGAGVLLATALVHILPEVREQMSSNFAEIALCAGFFIIYFIDEFIHYFFGEAIQHSHNDSPTNSSPTSHAQNHNNHSHNNYGTLDSETAPLLSTNNANATDNHSHSNLANIARCVPSQTNNELCENTHSHTHCNDTLVAEANARICHSSHTEPCAQTMTGTLGLFVALSLHSAIEGLAIGVQNSASKVLFLLGAVACHKFVMSFCLGLEIRSSSQRSLRYHIVGILVFALGAVCGIAIGMIIVNVPDNWNNSTLPLIQALAGGTLFYVTVCEVIPREKSRWHQNTSRKIAGFAQFLAVVSGFSVMTIINFYLDDDT